MTGDVYVVVEHWNGTIAEVSFELLGLGRQLAQASGGKLHALVLGPEAKEVAAACGAADVTICVEHDALAGFSPEAHITQLAAILKDRSPAFTLVSNTSKGMDVAPALAVALKVPVVTNVAAVAVNDGAIVATSQLYGGKIAVEAELAGGRAVLSLLAGAFPADHGKSAGAGAIETVVPAAQLGGSRVAFKRLIEAEASDVDISKQEILVTVGRGIQDKDNLPVVQELADALGCPLCASRPLVDAGWLPKSRQVGKSGVTVKPKIYLAIGLSGAPEHVQGMKDATTIIAVNSDPKAPIFDVAHFGVVADLFDVVPALTEKVRELRG
jgi:electron transfer flavoprotein alpha subunit